MVVYFASGPQKSVWISWRRWQKKIDSRTWVALITSFCLPTRRQGINWKGNSFTSTSHRCVSISPPTRRPPPLRPYQQQHRQMEANRPPNRSRRPSKRIPIRWTVWSAILNPIPSQLCRIGRPATMAYPKMASRSPANRAAGELWWIFSKLFSWAKWFGQ